MRRKLTHAHAGLLEALAPASAAVKDIQVLAVSVIWTDPVGQREMRFNHVGHVTQDSGCTLLAVFIHRIAQAGDGAFLHGAIDARAGNLAAHLVAADGFEAYGLEDVDALDVPADGRLPVDGLQDAARGRGRDDVVGDAFHLHLRAGEAGALAPDFQLDAVCHRLASIRISKFNERETQCESRWAHPNSGQSACRTVPRAPAP